MPDGKFRKRRQRFAVEEMLGVMMNLRQREVR